MTHMTQLGRALEACRGQEKIISVYTLFLDKQQSNPNDANVPNMWLLQQASPHMEIS